MKEFDKIYVGSSPVMMLDALNENLNKKKKILIIDKDKVLGGAWKCLNIFGFEGLENAVHYLLPNSTGYKFIEENFNIKLENSSRKYYAVKIFGLNILINVRNYLGKLLYSLNGGDQAENFTIPSLLKYLFKNRKVSLTKYPKEGIVSWVNCIIQSIYKSNVKINLEEEISQIEV